MIDLDTLIESAVTDAIAAGDGKIIGRCVREALEKAGVTLLAPVDLNAPCSSCGRPATMAFGGSCVMGGCPMGADL